MDALASLPLVEGGGVPTDMGLFIAVRGTGGFLMLARAERDAMLVYGIRIESSDLSLAPAVRIRRLAYCPAEASPTGEPLMFDTTDYEPPAEVDDRAIERFAGLPHWTLQGTTVAVCTGAMPDGSRWLVTVGGAAAVLN